MLIVTDRHTEADLALWKEYEETDRVWYFSHNMKELEERAIAEIIRFAQRGKFYIGVSWGKDSIVAAHLASRAQWYRDENRRRIKKHAMPLVWIKVNPIYNPYCIRVEKIYCEKYLPLYERIEVDCIWRDGEWHATGTLEQGAAIASEKYSRRYISGIDKNESGVRMMSRLVHGVSTDFCCRPIIDWPTEAVYAYLVHYDLPVHPNYAMLGGGRYSRNQLRVASLGGKRGDSFGRAEWEREYYPDILARIAKASS